MTKVYETAFQNVADIRLFVKNDTMVDAISAFLMQERLLQGLKQKSVGREL
jgi:hypothetical protein